MELIYLK